MDYEQKYNEALRKIRELIERGKKNRWTITAYVKDFEQIFPELKEIEDEKISREITEFLVDFNNGEYERPNENTIDSWLSWLERQGSKFLANSAKTCKEIPNELEECKIEHGKYYYCIKDYYAGGNKRASKGDVVQALNGMSMMDLGVNANKYFMPINNIEQKTNV